MKMTFSTFTDWSFCKFNKNFKLLKLLSKNNTEWWSGVADH